MGFTSYAGASGSFKGNATAGSGASANAISGAAGAATGPGGWHPTVLYLLGLVIAEIIVVAILSRTLLR